MLNFLKLHLGFVTVNRGFYSRSQQESNCFSETDKSFRSNWTSLKEKLSSLWSNQVDKTILRSCFVWCSVLIETRGESLISGCGVFGVKILMYFICISRCIWEHYKSHMSHYQQLMIRILHRGKRKENTGFYWLFLFTGKRISLMLLESGNSLPRNKMDNGNTFSFTECFPNTIYQVFMLHVYTQRYLLTLRIKRLLVFPETISPTRQFNAWSYPSVDFVNRLTI